MFNKQVLFASAMLAVTTQSSFAMSPSASLQSDLPGASAIQEGSFTLAPLAFVQFCMSNPSECKAEGSDTSVVLDSDKLRALNEVNQLVNARIEPDATAGGRNAWSLTTARGDCNDYAVQKRHDLIARGWSASALALAVVKTESGRGHLVLSVRTDRGDLVLDNLQDKVVAWDSAKYHWIKRQSASTPQHWVEVVGSVDSAFKRAAAVPDAPPALVDADNTVSVVSGMVQ